MTGRRPDEYTHGMVLRHRKQNRFLRVIEPGWKVQAHVYVRNSDGAGFELGDGSARWLTRAYLNRSYVLHVDPRRWESGE